MKLKEITTKVICIHQVTPEQIRILSFDKADVPEKDKIYTIKKTFFHYTYRLKDCKYAMHFKELDHGTLVGYDPKYFRPCDEDGNLLAKEDVRLQITKEDNPSWILGPDGYTIAVDK